MVWYGMVEVCEGAPVAVSGWVLTDRHDVRPCAASSLHRATVSVSNVIGGTGNTVVYPMYRRNPAPVSRLPCREQMLSLGGFGSRCLQGYLGARGHGPLITVAMRVLCEHCGHSERHWH